MSSTWATRLTNGDGNRLRFYVTISGIPYVFHTSGTALPSAVLSSTYTRFNGLDTPEQQGPRLDIDHRRAIGGDVRIMLKEDGSGTLADLFAPRVRPTTFIAADNDADDTTLTVGTTTDLPSAGTVYVGAETISYTSKTATTIVGCTRGAFGSKAQVRRGDSTAGEDVFETPPWWYGRRVSLFGYFEDVDGSTTADLDTQLGTFSIEENPKYDAKTDSWVLQCGELIDEFATKKLGRGIRPVPLNGQRLLSYSAAGDVLTLVLESGASDATSAIDRFVEGGAAARTYALLTNAAGKYMMFRLEDKTATGIEMYPGNRLNEVHPDAANVPGTAIAAGAIAIGEVRHVALLEVSPRDAILQAATSIIGDGTNGSDDVLPGRVRDDVAEDSWFFGAGIDVAEVDTAALNVANLTGVGSIVWPIFKEHDFAIFMEECCRRLGAFWYATRAGKLAVKRLESDGSSALTVDENIILPGTASIEFDEQTIHPSIELECQYNPIADKYEYKIIVNDIEMRERYANRTEPLSLKKMELISVGESGRFQNIVTSTAVDRDTLAAQLRDEQVADGRGRAIVTVTCDIRALTLELGDVVTLTVNLPDLEGASSITNRRALVVGYSPNYGDATIELRLMLLESRVHRISPAAVIQSRAGAVLTLRGNSSTFPEASDASPGEMFPDGADVLVWDVSGATSHSTTVLSSTATTVTLASAPAFANENDVDFIVLGTQPVADTAASTNGFTALDFISQLDPAAAAPPAGDPNGFTRLV